MVIETGVSCGSELITSWMCCCNVDVPASTMTSLAGLAQLSLSDLTTTRLSLTVPCTQLLFTYPIHYSHHNSKPSISLFTMVRVSTSPVLPSTFPLPHPLTPSTSTTVQRFLPHLHPPLLPPPRRPLRRIQPAPPPPQRTHLRPAAAPAAESGRRR